VGKCNKRKAKHKKTLKKRNKKETKNNGEILK
jgi:hypothetical protein